MSSRTLKIDKASVSTARIQKIELQDRIDLGARVQKLELGDLRLEVKPARVFLRQVTVEVDLHADVELNVNLPDPFSDINHTERIGFEKKAQSHDDIELITPGLTLTFAVTNLPAGPLQASMDSIRPANFPAILANLVVTGIETGGIVLPTAGFDLDGLGIGALVLRDLQLPGVHLDDLKVTRVSAQGNLPIPRLGMSGVTLASSSAGTLDASGPSFSVSISLPKQEMNVSRAKLKITPAGTVTVKAGKLQLRDVTLSGSLGSVALTGVELTFDARGIRLSPLELEGVTAHELALSGSGGQVMDVKMSPIWGGPGGTAFRDELQDMGRLVKVDLRAGNYVDAIRSTFEKTDGSQVPGPTHGGSGGDAVSLQLQANEHITSIHGQYQSYLRFLELRTSLGRQVAVGHMSLFADCTWSFGGLPPVRFRLDGLVPGQAKTIQLSAPGPVPQPVPPLTITVPPDARPGQTLHLDHVEMRLGAENWFELDNVHVLGFHGRSGNLVDAIGVLYR